jgi:hypothetical protein
MKKLFWTNDSSPGVYSFLCKKPKTGGQFFEVIIGWIAEREHFGKVPTNKGKKNVQCLVSSYIKKTQSLKVQCHEIVCQLRPLVSSLGLNNMPRISFKLVKSRIKNIRHFKQGASRCKMAGAGFPCFAKLRAPTPRFATIRITAWQSALNHTADCQPPPSGLIRTLRAV